MIPNGNSVDPRERQSSKVAQVLGPLKAHAKVHGPLLILFNLVDAEIRVNNEYFSHKDKY